MQQKLSIVSVLTLLVLAGAGAYAVFIHPLSSGPPTISQLPPANVAHPVAPNPQTTSASSASSGTTTSTTTSTTSSTSSTSSQSSSSSGSLLLTNPPSSTGHSDDDGNSTSGSGFGGDD